MVSTKETLNSTKESKMPALDFNPAPKAVETVKVETPAVAPATPKAPTL